MEVNVSENLSLNRLAKVMDMNNGNVSTLCKKLEQQGYLTRERRADDERFITLENSPRTDKQSFRKWSRISKANTVC